jgi:hypothetical protein
METGHFIILLGTGGYTHFLPMFGQPISTAITSNTITVKTGGTVTPDSGLTWRKNGGAFSASAGTAVEGDKIQVKLTSSGSYETSVTKNLTINGGALPFVVVTMAEPVVLDDVTFGGDTVTMGGETAMF